jgi:hypothetical protein
VDNVNIKGISMSASDLRSTGSSVRIRISALLGIWYRSSSLRNQSVSGGVKMSPMISADLANHVNPQVLTERVTPGVNVDKLATIELKFERCRKVWTYASPRRTNNRSRSAVPVNEASKKGLSAVTGCVHGKTVHLDNISTDADS